VKSYPSIPSEIVDHPIYAFDKLDGSNIRAEWSRKRGFYKFGKRNHLLDDTNPMLQEARQLVTDGYAETMASILHQQRWDRAVCFFEFIGDRSFAGNHEDEPHRVVLFDVAGPKGILEPREYLKLFEGRVRIADLLYSGNPNQLFVDQVRSSSLPGMTFEGVVCKGRWLSPGRPLMFKLKSQAWIDRVRAKFSGSGLLEDLLS